VAFFHADACGIEIGFVAQHGEQNAAGPMGHRDDGGLVEDKSTKGYSLSCGSYSS